jgi:hypothetical protein
MSDQDLGLAFLKSKEIYIYFYKEGLIPLTNLNDCLNLILLYSQEAIFAST